MILFSFSRQNKNKILDHVTISHLLFFFQHLYNVSKTFDHWNILLSNFNKYWLFKWLSKDWHRAWFLKYREKTQSHTHRNLLLWHSIFWLRVYFLLSLKQPVETGPSMSAILDCEFLKGRGQIYVVFQLWRGFPGDSDGKESVRNAGDLGSIPGLGRYLEEGND